MLIIFDLDDTLVDTSVSSSPLKRRDALSAMVNAGFNVADFEKMVEILKEIDRSQESFRQTLAVFARECSASEAHVAAGLHAFYHTLSSDIPVAAVEGANQVLQELGSTHDLAIVTRGVEKQQQQKLEKAGIDTTLFSTIVVLEEGCKGGAYAAIARDLGYTPAQVLVCGDRIGVDLSPAKALGFGTVHIRYGRGLAGIGNPQDVDYTIEKLVELLNIVEMVTK